MSVFKRNSGVSHRETKVLSLGEKRVLYILRSSTKAKRIQLKITKDRQLEVVVPHYVDISEGERFLFEKRDWVQQHLDFLVPKERVYYYLGKSYKVLHIHNPESTRYKCSFDGDSVHIESPGFSTIPPYDIFLQFLRVSGRKVLIPRCEELAKTYGFTVKKISLRGQKSRWGSCSRRG